MRLLHIILLVIYCHFTVAGFAGAWVMKRDLRTEERSAIAVNDPTDLADEGGAADEGDGDASPADPDQCHRPVQIVLISSLLPAQKPAAPLFDGAWPSLRPIDITTPPPRA